MFVRVCICNFACLCVSLFVCLCVANTHTNTVYLSTNLFTYANIQTQTKSHENLHTYLHEIHIYAMADGWTALHLTARDKRSEAMRYLVCETSREDTFMEVNCVHIYMHMFIHMYIYVYSYVCIYTNIHINIHLYMNANTHTCTSIYAYIYISVLIHIFVNLYIHMYMYMYIYTYTTIHTYVYL